MPRGTDSFRFGSVEYGRCDWTLTQRYIFSRESELQIDNLQDRYDAARQDLDHP